MTTMRDQIWSWIPEVYRVRDAQSGGTLATFVDIVGEQADLIADDIRQLYANWFIETCEDWAVPYIGDLVGYTGGDSGELPTDPARAALLEQILAPRRDVANAIRNRRRRGSVRLIEDLVADVSGWTGRVVENDGALAMTPSVRYPQAPAHHGVSVHNLAAIGRVGGPDDLLARTAAIGGRFAPAGVTVFVARLDTCTMTHTGAYCIDEEGSRCFTFDPLGRDIPLFRAGRPRDGIQPAVLPGPITRAAFDWRDRGDGTDDLFGEQGAMMIWRVPADGDAFEPVPADRVYATDLRHWRHQPAPGWVAIDPERGRIAFSGRDAPDRVRVSYRYGLSAPIGGGEYARVLSPRHPTHVYRVSRTGEEGHDTLQKALERWRQDAPESAVIEFADSHVYDGQQLRIDLGENRKLQIRAIDGARPILRIFNADSGGQDLLRVTGKAGSQLVIDGLMIAGRGLQLRGGLESVTIRHSTLVPGWTLPNPERHGSAEAPSIMIENSPVALTISHSIIGPILVRMDEIAHAPVPIRISDSIVDAGDERRDALFGSDIPAYATLQVVRSTVFGRVRVHGLTLAENSIFTGEVEVLRRQRGCVRFCYLPTSSRTPPRFETLPHGGSGMGEAPVFTSRRFGTPGYAQLGAACPDAIRTGADDESELGVWHDLFQAQREARLRQRIAENMPARASFDLLFTT